MENKNFQMWCTGCEKNIEIEQLKSESGPGGAELYCPYCGDNHFGFYNLEG